MDTGDEHVFEIFLVSNLFLIFFLSNMKPSIFFVSLILLIFVSQVVYWFLLNLMNTTSVERIQFTKTARSSANTSQFKYPDRYTYQIKHSKPSVNVDSLQLKHPLKPCGKHINHNSHFVDRPFWESLTDNDIQKRRQDLKDFIDNRLNSIHYDKFTFASRGIVYLANDGTFDRVLTSIKFIKHSGSSLPIEVWFLTGEFTDEHLQQFKELGVRARDLLVEQKRYPELNDFRVSKSYDCKLT